MSATVTAARAKVDPTVVSFSVLFQRVQPDPAALLASVIAYVDRKAQASIEGVRASWTRDWLRRRNVWIERVGKLLTSAEVAQVSPSMKTTSAVNKARRKGHLLAIKVRSRVYFPEFQFRNDGTPADWVRELVRALPDSDAMLQFVAGGRENRAGHSYAELLRRRPDTALVEQMLVDARRQVLAEAL